VLWKLSASAGLIALLFSNAALADPPDRVARLSYESGTVTFEPAGTQDWVQASLNRPLITGDALWVDSGSRAELNVGRAALRADAQTSVSVTNLDDQMAQFQLAQGTVVLRVRSVPPSGQYEIDTPNLALTVTQPGLYRVTVTADGQNTYVLVREGAATASGENQSYAIGAGQSYNFSGTDLSQYTYYDPPAPDGFDQFCAERDARWSRAASARYVSPDMIGYEDLDANGTWQTADGYGSVWVPNHVAADWAPYHDGHWAWVAPWGWTWVDDAPWGFAPFHYGRWVHLDYGWGWVPGPVAVAPVYAPALVAFVGGPGFGVAIGGPGAVGVAWFPLGPREVYRPGYEVSPAYVQRVNVSNTTVTTTVVNNVYNNTTVVHYANQSVPNAVTAVPSAAFAGGQPVRNAAIHLAPSAIATAQVTAVAPVTPTAHAVAGPGAVSNFHPSMAAQQRQVVARTVPPPAPIPFAAKAQALQANPGHPIAPAAEQQLRATPGVVAARPVAHVIATPAPTAITPARVAPAARPAAAGAAPVLQPRSFDATAPRPPSASPAAVERAPANSFARPSELPPASSRPAEPAQNLNRPQQLPPARPAEPVQPPAQAARPEPARPSQQHAPSDKNDRDRRDER
jgi:hypothetical protein